MENVQGHVGCHSDDEGGIPVQLAITTWTEIPVPPLKLRRHAVVAARLARDDKCVKNIIKKLPCRDGKGVENSRVELAIAASLHAVSAIYWFVASRLERQLSDASSAACAAQVDAEHLTGWTSSAHSTAHTAAHTTAHAWGTSLAESAVAVYTVDRTIT